MKLNQGNIESGFTLVEFTITIVVLVVLAAMLLPAIPRPGKASAKRINCTNNLRQIGLAYHQWANDHNENFPTGVSLTNGGAMEAVLTGDVAMAFRVVSNLLDTPKILYCPADERRIQATTFEIVPNKISRRDISFLGNSNVSYFVGLDANSSAPQMFLAGDDNLLVGGRTFGQGVGVDGSPVKPGIVSLWTNTPIAWADSRHGKQGNVGLSDGSVQKFSSSKLAEGLRNTWIATNRLVFP